MLSSYRLSFESYTWNTNSRKAVSVRKMQKKNRKNISKHEKLNQNCPSNEYTSEK